MYLFFHLFVGLVLGVILNYLFKDVRLIPVCIVVSVIPDVIDKALAFNYAALSSGRTVAHSLVFLIAILLLASIVFYKSIPFIVAITLALFSHTIADSMWLEPKTLFYPFMGAFKIHYWNLDSATGTIGSDWISAVIHNELNSGMEWMCAALLVAMGFLWVVRTIRRKPA